MADKYCNFQVFGKVGDKSGFAANKMLATDNNQELILLDINSGVTAFDCFSSGGADALGVDNSFTCASSGGSDVL